MAQDAPLVSVVIPTFNRPDLLERAVRSVLAQTMVNLEILVVNDAGAPVEDLLYRLDNGGGRIVSIRLAKNGGRGAVRNAALKIARGKYIAYLDDDDYYYPEHLEVLSGFLERSGEKVAYTDSLNAVQQKRNGVWETLETKLHYSYDFDYDHIFINNYIPTLCIMHARECLDKAGLFDETLLTQEDWDMWLRVSLYYKFHHIARVTSEYTNRLGEVSQSRTDPQADFYATLCRIHEKYAHHLADKPALRARQEEYRRLTRDSYEKVYGDRVSQFMHGIMQKLDAQDFRGALAFFDENRAKVQFDSYAAELQKIDELMQKVRRSVR